MTDAREIAERRWLDVRDCFMAALADAERRVQEAERWVADLQSGMYINCVYCGHRYGPSDQIPATIPHAPTITMADVLREHIERCPKHPLSHERAARQRAEGEAARLREVGTRLAEHHDREDHHHPCHVIAVAEWLAAIRGEEVP